MLGCLRFVNIVVEVFNVVGNEVWQIVTFRTLPALLDWIQCRRVRRKPLEGEPVGMVLRKVGCRRAMHGIAVPNYDHSATVMAVQLPQEPNDVLGARVFPQELEIMR